VTHLCWFIVHHVPHILHSKINTQIYTIINNTCSIIGPTCYSIRWLSWCANGPPFSARQKKRRSKKVRTIWWERIINLLMSEAHLNYKMLGQACHGNKMLFLLTLDWAQHTPCMVYDVCRIISTPWRLCCLVLKQRNNIPTSQRTHLSAVQKQII
jgi:hypothetical protein